MARPTTKQELLAASAERFGALWKLIDGMTGEQRQGTFAFEDRDKNVRDVLIHLYEWHQLVLKWVAANQAGNAQPFLPAPYNWKTYPAMNVGFWQKHQATPYAEAETLLKGSHAEVTALMEGFSNEELFTKKHFSWTGTTSLGSYFISSTASHYDWAIKKLKQHLKTFA